MCAFHCRCVWEKPSNALNWGPWARSFVRKNDSSCLIQARLVGERSQCRITSFHSFEMFGVIKNVWIPWGVGRKHSDYGICVRVNAATRHQGVFLKRNCLLISLCAAAGSNSTQLYKHSFLNYFWELRGIFLTAFHHLTFLNIYLLGIHPVIFLFQKVIDSGVHMFSRPAKLLPGIKQQLVFVSRSLLVNVCGVTEACTAQTWQGTCSRSNTADPVGCATWHPHCY